MLRVNQAGEYGATRIYAGQLAVLAKGSHAAHQIARMARQEQRHLDRFDALLAERRVRPTALQPMWNVAGFMLGAATALDLRGSGDGLHRRGRDRDRPPLFGASSTSLATATPNSPPISPNFAPRSLSIAIPRVRSAPKTPLLIPC